MPQLPPMYHSSSTHVSFLLSLSLSRSLSLLWTLEMLIRPLPPSLQDSLSLFLSPFLSLTLLFPPPLSPSLFLYRLLVPCPPAAGFHASNRP
jgi:hypothetical protein